MTESHRRARQNSTKLDAARAVRAVTEHVGRLLQALSPQPHLQPVPVRVRERTRGTR